CVLARIARHRRFVTEEVDVDRLARFGTDRRHFGAHLGFVDGGDRQRAAPAIGASTIGCSILNRSINRRSGHMASSFWLVAAKHGGGPARTPLPIRTSAFAAGEPTVHLLRSRLYRAAGRPI